MTDGALRSAAHWERAHESLEGEVSSIQLQASRRAVHTIGITETGILYVDLQRFARNRSEDARTFYVRAADVARIKRLVRSGRPGTMTDGELVKLFAASFHSAEYALEWLRWAGIPTVRCHDEGACHNAEARIPDGVFC